MAQLSEVKIQCQNNEHIEGRCEASKENNSQNALTLKVSDLADTPMCRICYNGPSRERLLKPCKCKGTIKNVHRSCLERWLESTSTDTCELCNHRFATKRSHKSFWHWCRQPETRRDRRNFIGDCACFLFLTPLGFATFWLCTEGAVYFQRVRSSLLETVALIILAFFLVLAYVTWIALCTRYHLIIWSRWRNRNYSVRIVDRPSSTSSASSASEIETINLSEPPATNHRLPIIAHPLPALGTLPRHLMNGPPRLTVSFTRRPQIDEPQRNTTLNMYATRCPQMQGPRRSITLHPHAIRRLQMNDPRRNPSLNPYVTRPQMNEPPRNQTLDSHDTRRSEMDKPLNNLTFNTYAARPLQKDEPQWNPISNPCATRCPQIDETHINPTPNQHATRHPQIDELLKSPTVNPNVIIRPFSVNEPERILSVDVQHPTYPPTPFPSV